MKAERLRILVLCKTYPSPSAKYAETSCVAGITEDGKALRLYPVPFRMIKDDHQFKKWQWIEAMVRRSPEDRRPESHRIYVDTINLGEVVPRNLGWSARLPWIAKLPTFYDFDALEQQRSSSGSPTLALLKPIRIRGLDITPVDNPEWTQEEKDKLLQIQRQGNLFDATERDFRLLRKLPFDFHYRYECESEAGHLREYRHKLVDWEVGALFWNLWHKHGAKHWEEPFRNMIERELPARDLSLLLGTIHRFPDQWLIVSLIYPPKRSEPENDRQQAFLF
jgi:hypothetical protein